MHELSVAQGVLKLVREHVPQPRWTDVRDIHVDVGRMAGVVPDSLDFCFSALVAETDLAAAHLNIRFIPLRLSCDECGATRESDGDAFRCASCNSHRTHVVSGMELRVAEIELQDQLQEAT